MEEIAIILILFQLIGCAKQPAITVKKNQNENENKLELSKLEAEIETIRQERENYKNKIFWYRIIGVRALVGIALLVRYNRKLTNEINELTENNQLLTNKMNGLQKAAQDIKDAQQDFESFFNGDNLDLI